MNLRTISQSLVLGLALWGCSNGTQFGLPPAQDNFGQSVSYNNKVDIVMIVDNSSSMDLYQQHLLDQMPSMIQTLNSLKMDYHIAVITSSVESASKGGVFTGSPAYLTNSSANLVAAIQSRIRAGVDGANLSRPLLNFTNILFSSYMSNQASGFLRNDALTAILTLSDDNDKSVLSTTDFYQKMQTLKPAFSDGSISWIYNYIGVTSLSSPCHSNLGTVTPGVKHVELAGLTNGITAEICSPDLSIAVSNVKARIVQVLTDYKLSKKPKVETIKVYINGRLIANDATNGWTYEATANVVRFHGNVVPASDASIVVTFDPSQAN